MQGQQIRVSNTVKVAAIIFLAVVANGVGGVSATFSFTCSLSILENLLSLLLKLYLCLVKLLIALVGEQQLNTIQCDIVFNNVLQLLPPNTASLLNSTQQLGGECSQSACDTDGYWDIYCKAQCIAAGYETGMCGQSGVAGNTNCTCAGASGDENLQTVYLICAVLGSCACQTCQNSEGGTWSVGDCEAIPNGVVLTCSS